MESTTDNPRIWPRPEIVPVPDNESYALNLNGKWKFTDTPGTEYWKAEEEGAEWDEVPVPGDLSALGYDVRSDREIVYKRKVILPAYSMGTRILLRINRAGEYCKVWVDGHFVRDHRGAYTAFDCDLSGLLEPGRASWITVLCVTKSDCLTDWVRPSGSPACAGMMGDVQLLVLPQDYLTHFHYETDFDEAYQDAVLKVTAAISFYSAESAVVHLKLFDPAGGSVTLEPDSIRVSRDETESAVKIPIAVPVKWDAEHPELYHLTAEVEVEGVQPVLYTRQVGFRKIEKKGNNLYVNGRLTKLRGIARYSHDPIHGKVFSDEQIEAEVRMVKDANINFIRLSVYPEKEKYMELCDRLGIYLQVCTPVTFQQERYDSLGFPVYRHTCNLPKYKAVFMDQFAEMIEMFRSHPSIILWEFANESDWGVNLKTEIDYARQEDPGRLTSGTWGNEHADLFCYHYPEYNEIYHNAALYDEYIHIATHAMGTLRRDPAIRNAWGLSLHKGWKALYEANGVVGAAIFALGEFVVLQENGKVQAASFGQWGILDTWLREKPEWWLTKKGYSPVEIEDEPVRYPGVGKPLEVPVRNRFNNTDFKELRFQWKSNSENGCIEEFELAPRAEGRLVIPVKELETDDAVQISVFDSYQRLIDAVELKVYSRVMERNFPETRKNAPEVAEDDLTVKVCGTGFQIEFSKATGLITSGAFNGCTLIKGGPYLNFVGLYYKATAWPRDNTGDFELKYPQWTLEKMSWQINREEIALLIDGSYPGCTHMDGDGNEYGYEAVRAHFKVSINGSGLITTQYTVDNPPRYLCCEAGVSYILTEQINRLSWERNALYSVYPDDHIGRPRGIAPRYRGYGDEVYRKKPEWSWALDEREYVLDGADDRRDRGTRDFRCTREKVWYVSAIAAKSENRVRVESDGKSLAVRAEVPETGEPGAAGPVKLNMNHILYYELGSGSLPGCKGDRAWGNYTYPEVQLQPGYCNSVRMRLTDNDRYSEA